jgi:hypothetical protein
MTGIEELDLSTNRVVRNGIRVSAEDRKAMGSLAKLKARSADACDIMHEIANWLAEEIDEARNSPDLLALPKAIANVKHAALALIADGGYDELVPLAAQMQDALEEIVRIARRALVRRLLSAETSEEDAKKIVLGLAALTEAGHWTNFEADFESAVEAARCNAHQPSR